MKKNLLLLFYLAFFATNLLFAQTKLNVDSLIIVLNRNPTADTVRAKILVALSEALIKVNAKDGIAYSETALTIAEKFNKPELKADAFYTKARHLELTSNYAEALDLATKSLEIYEQLRRIKKIPAAHNLLGRIYYDKQDEENTKKHYERALTSSEQIGDIKNKIIALGGLASLYDALDEMKASIAYNKQALDLAEKQHYPALAALAAGNLGIDYVKQGNYRTALEYTQKALRIDENLNNNNDLIYDYITLGNIYLKLSELEKALGYCNKALPLAIKVGDKFSEAQSFERISGIYVAMKKYKEAAVNIEKSIAIYKAIGNTSKANSNLLNLGIVYAESQRMVDAHRCFQEVLEVSKKANNKTAMASALVNIANIYVNQPDSLLLKMGVNPSERYTKTVDIATEALEISTKINSVASIAASLEILSAIHEKNKDYSKAYDFYKKYVVLKDSISGDEVKKQITRKEIQYEYDKKETALLYEQKLTTEQLAKQKALTTQQQQALTLNTQDLSLKTQALLLANKEKDLQHLAFLKEKAEKQEKEQALLLVEKGKDLATAKVFALAKEKALQIQEIARKNATIGFLGASLLAILLAATVFYLWLQRKQARKQAAQQAQFTQQLLATTEDERGRIARDLHDGISHELLSLRREISQTNAKTSEANAKIDTIIEDVRQISRNLHPVMLDSIGLKLSLETLCEQFGEREALFVSYDIDYTTVLSKNTELQLFRIVQEALTNTVKYAKANASKVVINEIDGKITLSITDNGKGFDVQKRLDSGQAFGLHSILQRAKAINATAKIESSGKGTVVNVLLG